jgi:hypothetical protein
MRTVLEIVSEIDAIKTDLATILTDFDEFVFKSGGNKEKVIGFLHSKLSAIDYCNLELLKIHNISEADFMLHKKTI